MKRICIFLCSLLVIFSCSIAYAQEFDTHIDQLGERQAKVWKVYLDKLEDRPREEHRLIRLMAIVQYSMFDPIFKDIAAEEVLKSNNATASQLVGIMANVPNHKKDAWRKLEPILSTVDPNEFRGIFYPQTYLYNHAIDNKYKTRIGDMLIVRDSNNNVLPLDNVMLVNIIKYGTRRRHRDFAADKYMRRSYIWQEGKYRISAAYNIVQADVNERYKIKAWEVLINDSLVFNSSTHLSMIAQSDIEYYAQEAREWLDLISKSDLSLEKEMWKH